MSSQRCKVLQSVSLLPNYHRKDLHTLPPQTERHRQLASSKTTSTWSCIKMFERKAWQQRLMYACVLNIHKGCNSMFLQRAAEQNESQKHESLGWGGRLLAFHWALASHVVRGAVVHLQLPPWLREGVNCGRGGQWRAMVCLYMHLKVGRSGETWDQKNKEQGSCWTHWRPRSGCSMSMIRQILGLVWPITLEQ